MNEAHQVPVLTSEAARLLGVSEATVRLWERVGKLPALRTEGGVRLFDRRDVERCAREREQRRGVAHETAEAVA